MSEFLKMNNDLRNTMNYAAHVSRYGLTKMPPLIISCAITGGLHGAEMNPNLPEDKASQVQQAYDAYNAGAALVHIHARDPKNLAAMTTSAEDYKELNARVREKCPDIIVNNTCMGGRMIMDDTKQASPMLLTALDALPEVSSIDLACASSYMPTRARKAPLTGRDQDGISKINYMLTQGEAIQTVDEMQKRGIKPELEVFFPDDIVNYIVPLIKSGVIKDAPYWVQVIFGGNGTTTSIENLLHTTQMMPENSLFSVIGVGAAQTAMITAAMIMGHHVRVGMEDNFVYGPGELAKSNAQLVERVVRIARELGRPIATPAQAREMMGLGAPRAYNY
ncbi:MAG: 3-keto-5-aminohexanoate cleavage protein [Oscillibacter sp.]